MSLREGCGKLSFYKHRIHIKIEGFRTDKLIDKAFRSGIVLENVRVVSDTEVRAEIAGDELKALKKLAKALYRITPMREEGLRPRLRVLKKQPLWCVGIIVAAAIVLVRASFISEIIVDGYTAIPEQSLRQCLAESGIYEGAYRPSIAWEEARMSLFRTFPQITWVKLVYDGMTVYLDIAETDSLIQYEEEEGKTEYSGTNDVSVTEVGNGGEENVNETDNISYTNLTAAKSGYIESINPIWGEAMVEAGDFVKKGQVLIAGCIPIEPTTFEENAAKEYYVRAQGEVWARVPYRLNFAQERYISSGKEAAVSQDENAADEKLFDGKMYEEKLSAVSEKEFEEQNTKNVITSKRERTDEEIKAKAEQQIRLWAKENLPENAEIINKSLNFTAKENIIEIGVTLEVHREISEEQEIIVGQENSDNRGD